MGRRMRANNAASPHDIPWVPCPLTVHPPQRSTPNSTSIAAPEGSPRLPIDDRGTPADHLRLRSRRITSSTRRPATATTRSATRPAVEGRRMTPMTSAPTRSGIGVTRQKASVYLSAKDRVARRGGRWFRSLCHPLKDARSCRRSSSDGSMAIAGATVRDGQSLPPTLTALGRSACSPQPPWSAWTGFRRGRRGRP